MTMPAPQHPWGSRLRPEAAGEVVCATSVTQPFLARAACGEFRILGIVMVHDLGIVMVQDDARAALGAGISNVGSHVLGRCVCAGLRGAGAAAARLCRERESNIPSNIGAAKEGKCLEATVRGEAITEELWDTALCEKGQLDLEQCTVTAKEIVGVCPIYFFGRTRQGKSTLINNLLQELGDNTRPAKEHHMAPCTKGVHMHRQECTAWTTQSVKETVVLVDTKGWEFEGNEGDLFADCLAKAEREKIRPEVLHQRLVLVLVLGAENRHEISDSRFLGLVKRVCLQASEAAAKARGERPVLLPIVSKQDLIDTYIQKATSDGLERVLNTVVGDIMNVQAPVFATNKSSACIVELRNQLASICRKQLASTTILRAVQESTEEELLKSSRATHEKLIPQTAFSVMGHC